MGNYRKKPVVIEAALFDGSLVGESFDGGTVMLGTCPQWFPAVVREVSREPVSGELRENEIVAFDDSLYIGTLEGIHRAKPGDWIIRGAKGEMYPCKPDIFAATYEAAP